MHDFHYKNGELYCEGVPVRTVAQRIGTPFYLYSSNTLANHFRAFDSAFAGVPHLICFALKSNSNGAVLRLLGREGAGADIVSGGELFRALRAGIDPKKIVYAGVGKRSDEIEYALKVGILMFNVESGEELIALDRAANEMHAEARIALRVNPNIDPKTHAYISTGLKENKFGIPIEQALEFYQIARGLRTSKWSACTSTSARRSPRSSPLSMPLRSWSGSSRSCGQPASTFNTSTSAAVSASPTRTKPRRCRRRWRRPSSRC